MAATLFYTVIVCLTLATVAEDLDDITKLKNGLLLLQQRVMMTEAQLEKAQTKLIESEVKRQLLKTEIQQQATQLQKVKSELQKKITDIEGKQDTKRIAFSASRKTTLASSISHDSTITYDTVWLNDGKGYNKQSGHFLAPVAGVYAFSYHVLSNSGKTVWIYIVQNGTRKSSTYSSSSSGEHNAAGNAIILSLAKGDQVWMVLMKGTSLYNNIADKYATFSGNLLYVK